MDGVLDVHKSLWGKICEKLHKSEEYEVQRLLGWNLIEENEELQKEAKNLLEILEEVQMENQNFKFKQNKSIFDAPAKAYLENQIITFIDNFRAKTSDDLKIPLTARQKLIVDNIIQKSTKNTLSEDNMNTKTDIPDRSITSTPNNNLIQNVNNSGNNDEIFFGGDTTKDDEDNIVISSPKNERPNSAKSIVSLTEKTELINDISLSTIEQSIHELQVAFQNDKDIFLAEIDYLLSLLTHEADEKCQMEKSTKEPTLKEIRTINQILESEAIKTIHPILLSDPSNYKGNPNRMKTPNLSPIKKH